MIKAIKKYKVPFSFVLPFYLCFFTFTVLPVAFAVVISFTSFNILEFPTFVGLGNYIRMFFADDIFMLSLRNTIVFAVIIGPVGYLLSLMMAWFINELQPKLRAVVTFVFYAPNIAGNMFMIWALFFSGDPYGYLNGILLEWGFINTAIVWLRDARYMTMVVILVSVWMSLGNGFLAFIAGFQGVDRVYFEAAAVDGVSNRWQELWFVTLPMMKYQMMFSAVMSITAAFGVGAVVSALMGNPSAGYAAHTVMNHLEDYGGVRFEMGYASAIASFLFMVMVGSNLLIKRLIGKVGT